MLDDVPAETLPNAALALAREQHVSLLLAAEAAKRCRACDLWAHATQAVFGQGPVPARLMLVGEQPGDHEDVLGEPFVGPAGRVLDEALAAAGIDREEAFVTNVVKHFKWKPAADGKRRLHDRPNKAEVGACLPWLGTELELVRPQALVALGATAAVGLLGRDVKVTRDHGRPIASALAPLVLVTIHPSAILRARDRSSRAVMLAGLTDDLRAVAAHLAVGSGNATAR